MKIKLLIVVLFLVFQFGFSQTKTHIKGIVLYDNIPVQGIEVANVTTKQTTVTNAFGTFSIVAKAEDILVFVSENYDYKRLFLKQEAINENNFIILLTKKPEELQEVVVTKFGIPKIKLDQASLDQIHLKKVASRPKVLGVYDGTIENGMDLLRIGGMVLNLFKKKSEITKNEVPLIEFKTVIKNNISQDFFHQTLELKPDEIELFLDFCDADPKSKTLLENYNVLSLMDFLMIKNSEFRKLPTPKIK